MKVSVGAVRMPSCLATSERSRPLADSSAAAVLASAASSSPVGVEDGVEDRGLLRVAGDPDVGDGHEPEARVLDPSLQHLRDDHLDPVGDLADPWVAHGSYSLKSPSRRQFPGRKLAPTPST